MIFPIYYFFLILNFLKLVNQEVYFNLMTLHHIIKNLLIQGYFRENNFQNLKIVPLI